MSTRQSYFSRRSASVRISNFEIRIFYVCLLSLPTAQAAVTYQETIRPIFQASCLNCHNPDKQKAGLDLSTYDATMDGSDNGKVVEPGDADKSLLLRVLTHAEEPFMPKGGDKLPDSQLEIIRQWIAANAPEKIGGAVAKKDAGPSVEIAAVEEKPKGPPAMPKDGLLEPVVHTIRTGAVPGVAGSPWAPLVALAAQEQVLLYNTDSLELAGVLPFPEGFPAVVRFSQNGSLVIAGGGIGAKLGHVVIWDVVTGKRIAEVGDEFDTVLAADISPDQSLVALGGPGRLVKIFSAADGKMLCKIKKHTDWVTALSFTPDGKELISGDRAGGLSFWDSQGHELDSVTAHNGGITEIACRGNIAATSSEDGTVKLWDVTEQKQLRSWHAHDGGVRSVAFTEDGHIVTSGRDHLVRLWDGNGNQVKQFGPLSDIAMQAAAAGGKIIASDWNGLVRVWTPDGAAVGDLDSNPPTLAMRVDAANKRLVDLAPLVARVDNACNQAAAALAAARERAADCATAVSQEKAALESRSDPGAPLRNRADAARNEITKDQAALKQLIASGSAGLCIALGDPLLQGEALQQVTAAAIAAQSVDVQTAALEQLQPALAAADAQNAAATAGLNARIKADVDAEAALKSAQASVASMQAARDKAQGAFKAATAELARWRDAQNRLNTNPQLASSKVDAKPAN